MTATICPDLQPDKDGLYPGEADGVPYFLRRTPKPSLEGSLRAKFPWELPPSNPKNDSHNA